MDINLTEDMKHLLFIVILIILPLIFVLIGAITGLTNALYYILSIFWFGMGLTFYGAVQ